VQIDRLLIVGYGSIGKRHLRIARELLPSAEIFVLRHKYCESIPEFANGCFSTLEHALAFAPQAAVIANPSSLHIQFAQPLAEANTHLLIEKPLSASLEGVNRLISTCVERKLILMLGYNLRFLPSLQEYRKLIHSGHIGRVISVRCEIGQYLPTWRPNSDYRQGVSASKALGGGVILELSHELDYLRWIFGEINWVKANLSKQSNLDIDVEDTAHLLLGFDPTNDGRKLIASLNMDFVRQDVTRQCLAIGEKGSLRWNCLNGQVELFPYGGTDWKNLFCIKPLQDESYKLEWTHFINCVNEGRVPLINGQDGLAVLNIIEAARKSSAESINILVDKVC
jgi:predicted dehydrogenase